MFVDQSSCSRERLETRTWPPALGGLWVILARDDIIALAAAGGCVMGRQLRLKRFQNLPAEGEQA